MLSKRAKILETSEHFLFLFQPPLGFGFVQADYIKILFDSWTTKLFPGLCKNVLLLETSYLEKRLVRKEAG